jgi:hypothetical protein
MKKVTEFCTYESTMIHSSRYNWQTNNLEVEFRGGGTKYKFDNVDVEDYLAFSNSEESTGKAFNQYIRKYKGEKVVTDQGQGGKE